ISRLGKEERSEARRDAFARGRSTVREGPGITAQDHEQAVGDFAIQQPQELRLFNTRESNKEGEWLQSPMLFGMKRSLTAWSQLANRSWARCAKRSSVRMKSLNRS